MRDSWRLIRIERVLGVFQEARLQQAVLGDRWLVTAANLFYGSLHLVVTVAMLVYLYRRHPDVYGQGRTALLTATTCALIGYIVYPTVPPRLLPSTFGFVDTLARYGTFWSFDSGAVARVSNQYAAMPSLHFAWALWNALMLARVTSRRAVRRAAFVYPIMTFGVIIVTANHFVLDAVFGAAVVFVGFVAPIVVRRTLGRCRTAMTPFRGGS